MRCRTCGEHFFGAVVFCRRCSSRDLEPVELSRQGTLYSYTIVRVPPPGWKGAVPYALGQVELPEGPHVLCKLDCPHEALRIGMRLELALEDAGVDGDGNQLVIYGWRKAADASGRGR
jgi:uncharacterized OB-fold protein